MHVVSTLVFYINLSFYFPLCILIHQHVGLCNEIIVKSAIYLFV